MKWLKHKEFPFWNKKSKTAFDVFLLKSEEVQKGKFETPQLEARLICDETYFLDDIVMYWKNVDGQIWSNKWNYFFALYLNLETIEHDNYEYLMLKES